MWPRRRPPGGPGWPRTAWRRSTPACSPERRRRASNGIPWFAFTKADRRVTCYYFYLWDVDFGPAFIKICAYFPYPAKVWLNGHEWAKRQAAQTGIGFTELSNGFAATDDPARLQNICDRLSSGTIRVFVERWLTILPTPLTDADRELEPVGSAPADGAAADENA